MQRDPSTREGLRTALNSVTKLISNDAPTTPVRASASSHASATNVLVWSFFALAMLIGFGIGSRIGMASGVTPDVDVLHAEVSSETTAGEYQLAAMLPFANAEVSNSDSHRQPARADAEIERARAAQAGSATAEALGLFTQTADSQAAIGTARADYHHADLRSEIGDGSSAEYALESLTVVTRGELERGDSLGSALERQGVAGDTIHLIASEMREVFDFRHSRPGDRYLLEQDSNGRLLDFSYSQPGGDSFTLSREDERYFVRKESVELHPYIAKIAGVVDSSFYGAVVALGEQSALAAEFARILAWDIDFSRNVHPGDEFQILYERLYRRNEAGEDIYVRPGRILAGRYSGRSGDHTVVFFEDESGEGAYFRPDGTSIERAFLAAPLESSRITSHFTRARRHPILKVTRPHRGIDYAAPHGTPVWSVADGVVEYKARAGASGNLIRIRHQGGLTSHYAHLSRFAAGLEVGDRVEQKQVIGYVGSTGLSTGPHVCFRVKQDGSYVDPLKISSPAGDPVEYDRLAQFQSVRDRLLADLGSSPISLVDEAL